MSNGLSQEAALVGQMVQRGSLFGSMSEKGAPGKDGKTPVKGADYWTEGDKDEIIKEVLKSDVIKDGINSLIDAKFNAKIKVVSSLPEIPDSDTLYLIGEGDAVI